jgi:PAS domain S-box-containing protein
MTTFFSSPSLPRTPILALLELQRRVLGRVAAEVPLTEVLIEIAREMEAHSSNGALVSISLLEKAGKCLRLATAPSLPEHYKQVIDSISIGPMAGACGAAAFSGEPVYVSDMATDPLGTQCRALVLSHGLNACWAIPIRGTDNHVLGTLAIYSIEPRNPAGDEVEAMAVAAQTVALVIERQRYRKSLQNKEARHHQIVNSATDFAIISTDGDGIITSWNEGAYRILGWNEQEIAGHPVQLFFTPEDIAAGQPEIERQSALSKGYATDERWHVKKTGQHFWASGQLTPLKDDAGVVIGFVKIMRDRTEHRRAELKLARQTEILGNEVDRRTRERDRIWRNSMDLLLAIGPDGVMHAVNPAWTALLGYEPNELVNRYFESLVHLDDVGKTVDAIAQASQGPLEHLEVRLRHKNGLYRWLAWRAAPEDGMVYANGRDITVEKGQAEQLLRAHEARLHMALEAGEMGVWEWNLKSNNITRLHKMVAAHGVSLASDFTSVPIKQYLGKYVHPEDQALLKAAIAQAATRGTSHQLEYRVLWPDGSTHWIEIRGQTLNDDAGAPARVVGVSIDITKRKRAEHDLKFLAQASAELASLVDPQSTLDRLAFLAVPFFADWCAIDLVQEDGRLARVAVAHADRHKVQLAHEFHRQFPPDPNLPQGVWSIIHTGRAQMVSDVTSDLLKQAFADPRRRGIMEQLGVRSYIGVPLSAHGKTLGAITFFAAESGRLYQMEDLALAEDLARRAAVAIENADLYRAVRRSDEAKDVFLATLSHELRNPLAAIVSGLSVTKLAMEDKERVAKYVGLMERQAAQLTRLIGDLMDVSRIKTGKIELKNEFTTLASILQNAIETTRPQIEAAKHSLTVMLPDEPTPLSADPIRLAQVFTNLLTNAAKYTNQGGEIFVTLECTSEAYAVRVRDSGIGIATEMLQNIFKIFTQVTHPVERSHGGLGIGLSLVKGLVKMHGGSVQAFSAGLGHGSEFVVHLPRSTEQQSHAITGLNNDSSFAKVPVKAKRILVVDDNVDAANTVSEILRMLGNEVMTVHDGLGAVTAAAEMTPDIIILDIGLPGIDGYEAARRIREQENKDRSAVLIALTGWGQEDDKQRAYQAGFDQHWVKPVSLDQLKKI